jgi:hypothetical protein
MLDGDGGESVEPQSDLVEGHLQPRCSSPLFLLLFVFLFCFLIFRADFESRWFICPPAFASQGSKTARKYGTAPSSERLQRAMKGHWVAWPQYLGALVEHVMELPQSPEDLAEQLQVSLVGPSPYSEKELSDLLQVDPRRIRVAFEWLSTRHEDYAAITWNFRTASRYQSELPSEIFVSRIEPSAEDEAERSGYAQQDEDASAMPGGRFGTLDDEDPIYEENPTYVPVVSSSGIVDLNGGSLDLRARQEAALEKVTRDPDVLFQSRSSGIDISDPPGLLPRVFFCLYPYGVGGFQDLERSAYASTPGLLVHLRALLLRSDRLFAEHPFWLFFGFDLLQRQRVARFSSVRASKPSFGRSVKDISSIKMDDLVAALRAIKDRKDYAAVPGVQELFRSSLWVTGQLVGSDQSRSNSRKELKVSETEAPFLAFVLSLIFPFDLLSQATVTAIGLPSIWLTINPPDTKSAILLKFASGDSIDLDDAFQLQLPTPNQRSVMVAKNPVAAAR